MNAHREERASLLIIARDRLFGRALETVFEAAGFSVTHARDADDPVRGGRMQSVDAIVLHQELLDADAPGTCARLRDIPEIGRRTPLIVASTARLTSTQRRDGLRAGAWHIAEAPFNPEELALQLDAFIEAKREAEGYREAAFLDPITGLYTPKAIEHRALEVAATAARAEEPLACVVFSPAVTASTRETVAQAVAQALRVLGRRSDVIGALSVDEFAVLAPGTPPRGVARLAERVSLALQDDVRPDLRAGFDIADTVDDPTTIAPRLIDHARRAARQATNRNGRHWLREYRGM